MKHSKYFAHSSIVVQWSGVTYQDRGKFTSHHRLCFCLSIPRLSIQVDRRDAALQSRILCWEIRFCGSVVIRYLIYHVVCSSILFPTLQLILPGSVFIWLFSLLNPAATFLSTQLLNWTSWPRTAALPRYSAIFPAHWPFGDLLRLIRLSWPLLGGISRNLPRSWKAHRLPYSLMGLLLCYDIYSSAVFQVFLVKKTLMSSPHFVPLSVCALGSHFDLLIWRP